VRRDVVAGIEALYRAGFPVYLRVAVAIVGEEQLARDAVHDAFVQAVRHARTFRADGSLEGWLWRIVVNEARKRRAKAERMVAVAQPVTVEAPSQNGASEDRGVRELVAALPERQRLVLFLRYYADLDYEAIAGVLGISRGTVGATLSAAHRALRRQLEEVQICPR
jgi:RNA polymerase sigma-70 factor, ECF subfamily